MIGPETEIYCLLGNPVRHSLSPAMHNAGFRALGINAVYLAFEPDDIGVAVQGLREIGASGFNVTMPFKAQIIRHLDRVDGMAEKIGAVNTVVNRNGKLVGFNTDGIGAVNALKKATAIAGKKILLIGCGGAGSAIAFCLKKENAAVVVADRNESKAAGLAKKTGSEKIGIGEITSGNSGDFDVVINATPVGMEPNHNETPMETNLLRKNTVIFDIVYEPRETRFLREAKKRGCATVSGIEMLLEQGYEAFRLFTGKEAPRGAMRKAVMGAIGKT